jgi:two-component system, NtrC family, response regulator AtoC
MKKLLVIDDERAVRYSFERAFREDYTVLTAENALDGLAMAEKERPDVVIMDIKMPGMSGIEGLGKMRERVSGIPVVLMTAFGDMDTAIEAMNKGAYDYITKPFENNELRRIIEKAIQSASLFHDAVCVGTEGASEDVDRIVGSSAAILSVCKLIGQVAQKNVPVLLLGESGVGKELVARAINTYSKRKERLFMAVNCAALAENLVESELFGYEQGAFTGADRRRPGRFEQCDGGTIFLDEIGDMTAATQAKVLRVLQDGTFERLGGNQTIKVDVRVIAATNKNVQEEVRKGQFRADLYHRLNVFSLRIPPLRERKEDIPILVEYFINRANKESGQPIRGISPEALSLIEGYSWPGNVRELQNTIRRAAILSRGAVLSSEDIVFTRQDVLPLDFHSMIESAVDDLLLSGDRKLYDKVISDVEKSLIRRALELTRGNQVKAASLLGISRVTLRKKIDDFQLHLQ